MHYLSFLSFPAPFSILKFNLKYTKEILQKKIFQKNFKFSVFTPYTIKNKIWKLYFINDIVIIEHSYITVHSLL